MSSKLVSSLALACVVSSGVSQSHADETFPTGEFGDSLGGTMQAPLDGTMLPPDGIMPPPDSTMPPQDDFSGVSPDDLLPPFPDGSLPPFPGDFPPDGEQFTGIPDGVNPDEFFGDLTPEDVGNFTPEQLGQFDPEEVGNFTPDQFSHFDPSAMAGFDAEHVEHFDPTAFGGLDQRQLGNFDPQAMEGFKPEFFEHMDPALMAGFTPEQMGEMNPFAMGGITPDQLGNFDPSAMAGLAAEHLEHFDPAALAGLDQSQLGNFDPQAMEGFKPEFFEHMDPALMAGFTPEQMGEMNPDAMGGITPDQFGQMPHELLQALDRDNMGGFSPDTIQRMLPDVLAQLNSTEFQNMPDGDFANMMVNFDPTQFTPEQLSNFIPPNWQMNPENGELTPPPGADIALPPVDITGLPNGLTLPQMPNLNLDLGLGGQGDGNNILAGMQGAMEAEGLSDFILQQQGGILQVEGTGPSEGVDLAFIPDTDGMKQAPEGTPPGLSIDENGNYVLTSPDGIQVPVIPAPHNPEAILDMIPNGIVNVGEDGGIKIQEAGQHPVNGIFDPFMEQSDLPPGIHRAGIPGQGEEILMVYPDGTSQVMHPMIQTPDAFKQFGQQVEGVNGIEVGPDGVIIVDFEGAPLTIVPGFEVIPGTGPGGDFTPGIEVGDDGSLTFINENGDQQSFFIQN